MIADKSVRNVPRNKLPIHLQNRNAGALKSL